MLTVHELARKGHFNIRDSQLSALCGYKHPVLVNWGGEEETQSWKWPRVQEVFFFSLEDSHDSRQTEAERPHPSWKAIFIPVWLHVLPRGTLIVSHSVEATKRQAFQNTQTITLFFFLHTTENNCKLRLSKRSAVCSAQFEVILVSQQSEGENQRWLLSGWTVCPIRRFQWLQLQRHCANVVVTLCVCVCE